MAALALCGGKKLVLSTSFGGLKGFHDGELKKITYLLSQKMGITNLFLGRNFQYYIIYYTILLYLHIHNTIIQENKTHSKNIYAI